MQGYNRVKIRVMTFIGGLVLLGLLVGITPSVSRAQEVDEGLFREIEGNLMCTDGCGMYLPSCDNATAQQMRAEIRGKLAEGANPSQIYAYMISIYGEEVMAAPPPQSRFNLTAWVFPFLLILAGGLVIYLALDKWVFNREVAQRKAVLIDEAEIEAYGDILDAEIRKFL